MNIREQLREVIRGNTRKIYVNPDVLKGITLDYICYMIYLKYHNNFELELDGIGSCHLDYVFQKCVATVETDCGDPSIVYMLYIIQGKINERVNDCNHYCDSSFRSVAKFHDLLDYPLTKEIIRLLHVKRSRNLDIERVITLS